MLHEGNMWLHFVCGVGSLSDAVLSSNISSENQFCTVSPWYVAWTVSPCVYKNMYFMVKLPAIVLGAINPIHTLVLLAFYLQ